jgi:hypothetical protein
MTMRACWCVVAAALAGCAGQVQGEVDDESVPAFGEAFYWTQRVAFFDIYHVEAQLVTYGDACRVTAELEDERRDAYRDLQQALEAADGDQSALDGARDDYAQRMDENDRALLPADYWVTVIAVNAEDDDDVEGSGFSFDPAILPEATMSLCHQKDYPDYDEIVDGDDDDNRECWVANDGELQVDVFADDQFQAHGDPELVQAKDTSDNAGDVDVSFGARHCEDYEDLFD